MHDGAFVVIRADGTKLTASAALTLAEMTPRLPNRLHRAERRRRLRVRSRRPERVAEPVARRLAAHLRVRRQTGHTLRRLDGLTRARLGGSRAKRHHATLRLMARAERLSSPSLASDFRGRRSATADDGALTAERACAACNRSTTPRTAAHPSSRETPSGAFGGATDGAPSSSACGGGSSAAVASSS